jgi:hypothetical protein
MMDNFLTYVIPQFCVIMATILLYVIVKEVEKTNKNKGGDQ